MNNELLGKIFKDFMKDSDEFGDNNANVIEYSDCYEVDMELPGFRKSGIHIKYDDDTLCIKAVHDLDKSKAKDGGEYIQQEINNDSVDRDFYLPDVKVNDITADYNGGMLKVVLPRADKNDGNNNNIKIN